MAVTKKDKETLETLEKTANGMLLANLDIQTIKTIQADQIHEIEIRSGGGIKIKTSFKDGRVSLVIEDPKDDYIRVRPSNEEKNVLRAKANGVAITTDLFKKGKYEFSNEEIAVALEKIADRLRKTEEASQYTTYDFDVVAIESGDEEAVAGEAPTEEAAEEAATEGAATEEVATEEVATEEVATEEVATEEAVTEEGYTFSGLSEEEDDDNEDELYRESLVVS